MRYKIKDGYFLTIHIEEFFTLIDYMLLMFCFLLGLFFSTIIWIFGLAVFIKLFVSHEYVFNTDIYKIEQYLRLFSYFRLQIRIIPFGEINSITFTDSHSEHALSEKGFLKKVFYTIDIVTPNKVLHICKTDAIDGNKAYKLFNIIYEELASMLTFSMDVINSDFENEDEEER